MQCRASFPDGACLGIVASLIRSDLKIPPEIYAAMTIDLLFAIGLKGGAKLEGVAFSDFWKPLVTALSLSLAIPAWNYILLQKFGKFDGVNAVALSLYGEKFSAETPTPSSASAPQSKTRAATRNSAKKCVNTRDSFDCRFCNP